LQEFFRVVFGEKVFAAEFRIDSKKFLKRATRRRLHESHGYQAHPEQSEGVVILSRGSMMVGKTKNPGAHALGGSGSVGGFQVEPGDAKMLTVVKLVRGKREILEGAEKAFVVPHGSARTGIGVGHKVFLGKRRAIGTTFSLLHLNAK
jgi:hypothetical protein